MKELTTEQKAKSYDEALERARGLFDFYKGNPSQAQKFIDIFPELKENEDEKIRKCVEYAINKLFLKEKIVCSVHKDDVLSWLERQSSEPEDKGEISDGYHTFNELYYYRMLYNAAFFNMLPKEWVHKSKRHHDGEECFGGGWFIVMANLPTGQISNHYELKDWDLFQIPEKETADEWDGHTPGEAADRLHRYLLEKPVENLPSYLYTNPHEETSDETNAPTGYGKYVDDCLNEAAKHFFSDGEDTYSVADLFYAGVRCGKSWLERQGEQNAFDYENAYIPQRDFAPKTELEVIHEEKPDNANKEVVEAKFHEGDWITDGISTFKISKVDDNWYYPDGDGRVSFDIAHKYFHVWTIEDARDCDVLASDFDIVIFKECTYNKKDMTGCMFAYCGCGWWHELGGMNPVHYRPASNGERDLLFQRMKEDGYTFDFEKKELKKVDTYCQEHCKGYQETGRCFADGECQAKRDADSACRMDDKKMVDLLIDIFTVNYPNGFYKTNPANTLNMQGISSSEIIRWLKEVKAGMV